MADRLRPSWPALQHVFVVDGQPGDANPSWESFMATPWEQRRDPAELTAVRPDPNDVTLLMFTSGTTGEPKGVMHTHNTLVAAIAPLPERLGVSSDSVIHMASTVAHLTGLLYGVRLQTQLGATGVYQDVWSNEQFVELIEKHGITCTSAATPFLHDTLNAPNIDAHDVSSLVRFCCFGAPIPPAIVRQAKQRWPELAVVSGWGQTEDALVTLGIPGDPEQKVIERDGYPLPGMRIRVVDVDGTELPADTDGRLQVTGPFLFAGYAKRLEMTRELFEGRWFDTGDIARIDAEGYLRISGRTKDVIIRGGENIPVAYVENALYENPKIATVAVVGIPDPRLQERACACVVLKPGVEGHLRRDAAIPRREGWPAVLAGEPGSDPELPRRRAARSRSTGSAKRSSVRHDGHHEAGRPAGVPGGRGAHPVRPVRRRAGDGPAGRPGRPRPARTGRPAAVGGLGRAGRRAARLREPGRRGQPQRRPDGDPAGRPAGEAPRQHDQPALRIRPGRGRAWRPGRSAPATPTW